MDMTKEELRKVYKEKRRNLSSEEMERANSSVIKQLLAKIQPNTTVALFLPIKRHNEIDITPLLKQTHCNWVVSKSDFESGEMQFYVYEGINQIKENEWGIPEPVSGKKIAPEEIDLIIVPMIVCDSKGHRVGYGKGFYDRFLPQCRKDCKKIGVNFFPPVAHIEDMYEGDVKIDVLITPQRLFKL